LGLSSAARVTSRAIVIRQENRPRTAFHKSLPVFASSAAGGPFRGGPLRGWARPLEAVAAIDIGVGHTHGASFIRAGTGFPRLPLRSRGDRGGVWGDICFCFCRPPPRGVGPQTH